MCTDINKKNNLKKNDIEIIISILNEEYKISKLSEFLIEAIDILQKIKLQINNYKNEKDQIM